MKKGRRSGKNVSTAVRFTTAGSTSTCPKSGFTVPSRVRLLVRPYFTSAPSDPAFSVPSWNGSPCATA